MSLLPRLNDDFSTNPLTDPLYRFSGAWTYNSGLERLETTAAAVDMEILNSTNPFGTFETNITVNAPNSAQGSNKSFIRAFGYYFVFARFNTYIIDDNDFSWYNHPDSSGIWAVNQFSFPGLKHPYWRVVSSIHGAQHTIKFISTPSGLEFYIDGGLQKVLPHKSNIHNIKFGVGRDESSAFYIHDLLLKADSATPLKPTILAPAEAGSVGATQEVYVSVPASRLFVDLGSYAPGITGLSNVVYDPGGANVPMAEDEGIPTRSGGTTGDYYLEIPSNGVAYDYRLVIKEAFQVTNSVVVTDTIDFDVDGGPAAQSGSVDEDDDLHCYLKMSREVPMVNGEAALSTLGPYPPVFHNANADGNYTNIQTGHYSSIFDHNSSSFFAVNASVSFPIILDLDLGREYPIKRLNALPIVGGVYLTHWDVYSNTVPFSGASLVQGTLEYTNYPLFPTSSPTNKSAPYQIPDHPTLNFSTRYLRLVVLNASYFSSGLTTENSIAYELSIVVEDFMSINSDDDNAQFEFDSGGGFVAFPAGGVPQSGGIVKITLPSGFQLAAGERRFIATQFRADLTD